MSKTIHYDRIPDAVMMMSDFGKYLWMQENMEMLTAATPTTRPLSDIALDIAEHWPKINYAARPYWEAMCSLKSINDKYYADTAKSVVLYFLSNANTWRGEDAKRIKAELKEMLK